MSYFSLKADERLSPSEIVVQKQFFDRDNVHRVHRRVQQTVDNFYTSGDVADVMHNVFTQYLGANFNTSIPRGIVDRLNDAVVELVQNQKISSKKASQISRKVGFETSKIPTRILPRASFSVETEKVSLDFI